MAATAAPDTAETPLDRAVRVAVAAAPPLPADTLDDVARLLSKGGQGVMLKRYQSDASRQITSRTYPAPLLAWAGGTAKSEAFI